MNETGWRVVTAVLTVGANSFDRIRGIVLNVKSWMKHFWIKIWNAARASPIVATLVFVSLTVIAIAFFSGKYELGMFFVAFLAFAASLLQSEMRVVFFPPDIEIEMSEHGGVLVVAYTEQIMIDKEIAGFKGVRYWYFHLLVTNRRRFSPARSARVICRQLNTIDRDGNAKSPSYSPRIPLKWAHHDVMGLVRNLFSSDLCDLCSIREPSSDHVSSRLVLELAFANSAIQQSIGGGETFKLILEAEYEGGVTPKQWEVSIRWNGEWSADPQAMLKNVNIEVTRNG